MTFDADTATELLTKAGPPVTVSSLTFFGVALPDIVQIATAVYVVLLGIDKLYLMFLRYREDRNKLLHEIKGEDVTKE
jgi:hypothetical protein